MTQLDKVLYTARVHTTGGSDGDARSGDGRLDIKLSSPGTPGSGTNPEQLFAAGWSACFLSAVRIVAGKKKVTLPAGTAIDAEVNLCVGDGGNFLKARLNVSLSGLTSELAQALAGEADQTCPYSKATCGNNDVAINVVNSQLTNQTEEIHQ